MELKNYLIFKKNLDLYLDLRWDYLRKNNWIEASSDKILIKDMPDELPGEKTLKLIGMGKRPEKKLIKMIFWVF